MNRSVTPARVERRHRIAATRDRDKLAGGGAVPPRLRRPRPCRCRTAPARTRRTARSTPASSPAPARSTTCSMLRGPMSRIISSVPTLSTATTREGAFALNSLATTASTGSTISQPLAFALARISRAVGKRSCSHKDLPTACPSAARKVLAMAPPMTRRSTLASRLPSRSSLVDILAPPTIAATGRCRRLQRLRECVELFLHGAAGIARQLAAEALGRSMRAMRQPRTRRSRRCRRARRADRRRRGRRFPRRRRSACSPGTGYRPVSSHRSPPWPLRRRNRRRTPPAV